VGRWDGGGGAGGGRPFSRWLLVAEETARKIFES
jgi:hypothetical protein